MQELAARLPDFWIMSQGAGMLLTESPVPVNLAEAGEPSGALYAIQIASREASR